MFLALFASGTAATTTVLWRYAITDGSGDFITAQGIKDADGTTPLTAGTSANGDGAVIQLGYFTGATTSANFDGAWVPLTGPTSLNAAFAQTTIGDTSSGMAGAFGFFSIATVFDTALPDASMSLPAAGTRLSIVIFNRSSIEASSHCNIATNDAWQWQTPTTFPPASFSLSLDASGTQWFGGASTALTTSIPVGTFPGFPTIGTQPVNHGLDVGSGLSLSVAATGAGALSHQWFKDGTLLPGETAPTLTVANTTTANSGTYHVRIANAAGIINSVGAQVVVHAAPARLLNISTRGFVSTGDSILIPGFVALGTGGKTVLIRAVGPTLALDPYLVNGVLADPHLSLQVQATGMELAANNDWGVQNPGLPDVAALSAAMQASGAFPLPADSKDAALIYTAPVGTNLTALITGVGGTTGVAIAEIYIVDDADEPNARLVNISTRGFVGTGDNVMIPGFFLGPGGTRRLLVRAVGPTLGAIAPNLPPVIPNPVVRVRRSSDQSEVAFNNNWEDNSQGPAVVEAGNVAQAFALNAGSADAALILVVPPAVPGAFDRGFTVEVFDLNGGTGLALAEIYELP